MLVEGLRQGLFGVLVLAEQEGRDGKRLGGDGGGHGFISCTVLVAGVGMGLQPHGEGPGVVVLGSTVTSTRLVCGSTRKSSGSSPSLRWRCSWKVRHLRKAIRARAPPSALRADEELERQA